MARKVLFICTGNTCRSPMAEGIFRQASAGAEAGGGFEVSSAGVSAYSGSPASRETMAVLGAKGITLEGFQSRMVDEKMLVEAEAVFCMTASHLATLEQMFPEHAEKYHLVCDFVEIDGQVGVDVPDPYGMSQSVYDATSEVLEGATAGILAFLASRSE